MSQPSHAIRWITKKKLPLDIWSMPIRDCAISVITLTRPRPMYIRDCQVCGYTCINCPDYNVEGPVQLWPVDFDVEVHVYADDVIQFHQVRVNSYFMLSLFSPKGEGKGEGSSINITAIVGGVLGVFLLLAFVVIILLVLYSLSLRKRNSKLKVFILAALILPLHVF